jgi:pSer/pThr/pTyr-binding forkhead associated (FHA) protein
MFDGPIVTIGSDDACTLRLNDAAAAPEQAVLIVENNQWMLFNKADGTALNDEPLAREARCSLADGDELRVGEHVISFVFNEVSTNNRVRRDGRARRSRCARSRNPSSDALRRSGHENTATQFRQDS